MNDNNAVIMDTNVAMVANGQAEQAGLQCQQNCVAALRQIHEDKIILLDAENLIFEEYRRNLNLSGEPGAGDAFFKWLLDNQDNPRHCRSVTITPHPERGFAEFPDDQGLSNFDRSDRKFVAVALASGENPPVWNASDTDWWQHRDALATHGIAVHFICPELMERRS